MAKIDYSLYLVTDRGMAGGRPLEEIVRQGIAGGVTIVQLREKAAGTREFLRQAVAIRKLTSELGVPLIINDRLDVALACGADGVHLGQDDMACRDARKILGKSRIIGVSANTPEEALKAQGDGACYLGVSPVFDTPTKTDTPPAVGLDGVKKIRRAVSIPLVGIGGISADNAASVIRAGADGVAVVSAIMASKDPRAAAAGLVSAINRARGRRPKA